MNPDNQIQAQQFLQNLQELGTSCDEIANSLQKLGIKGEKESPDYCPIANYARSKGLDVMMMPYGFFVLDTKKPTRERVVGSGNLPKHVTEFIIAFDRGSYPSLEQ